MTAIVYPREFAADANFASGTDSGSPTKVDLGAAAEAQGIIAGLPFAAAHMNYSINAQSKVNRHYVEQCLLNLIQLMPSDAQTADENVFDGQGAAVANADGRIFLIKGGGVYEDLDGLVQLVTPSAASATTPTCAAGPRVATGTLGVVGSSGGGTVANALTRSTDGGSTWSHVEFSGSTVNSLQRIILNTGTDQFLYYGGTTGEVYASTTLGAKSTRALTAAHTVRGVAARSNGLSLVLRDNAGAPAFDSSPDDGSTAYAATGSAPTSTADYGDITSNGTLFFWAGKNASNQIAVWASSTGAAWSQVGTIAAPNSSTIGTGPSCRLICERGSGILWLALEGSARWYLYASPDSGVTWIGPRHVGSSAPTLSCAGGYLYIGVSGQPFLRTPFRLS